MSRRRGGRDPNAGWKRFHAEAGGAVQVHLIRMESVPELAIAALAGVPFALQLRRAVAAWILAADRQVKPPLCLACDNAFTREHFPRAFLVLLPHRHDPELGSLTGICEQCCHKDDAALLAEAERLLRQMWPDLRMLPVSSLSQAGRA